jgi:SAM-dependent methyltransferase
VLIIGLGGAPDVLTALYHGAQRIVGVEINRTTIQIAREHFADYLGRPYDRPEVELRQIDGRTFVRASQDRFDLIQMSGVDTKSVFAAGSLSLNENYLYTREAMREILARLRPDGLLALNRFGHVDLHRLASLALAGLRDLGVRQPERHLFAIGQGLWCGLLVRRTPFPASELAALEAWVAQAATAPDIVIPPFDWIGVSLRKPMELLYSPGPPPRAGTAYFEALRDGRVGEFVEEQRIFDLRPPVDDRPFFFFSARPGAALAAAFGQKTAFLASHVAQLLRSLHRVMLLLGGVACIFIFAPLLARRRRGLRAPGAAAVLGYFACLGAGFMLIEIGLIQRFVLLLGHQAYAVSVVIFGLLAGASVGSLLSARVPLARKGPLRAVLALVVGVVVLYGAALGPLFAAAASLPFPARLALALALLGAAGVPLGIPFPSALRALESSSVPFVAWGVGVNGFASVLAATAALEVSMLVGLRWLLVGAAALYALALALAPLGPRAPAGEPAPG